MSYMKYTQTATFLFPLVNVPKQLFRCDVQSNFKRRIMTTRFLNAYMWDKDLEFEQNYGPYVFVVVKPYRDSNYEQFHSTITALSTYVDEYWKGDYIVMIFKVPEENMEHYRTIREGRYSELTAEGKTLVLKNNYFKMDPNLLPRILNKCAELKASWERAISAPHPDSRYDSTVLLGDAEVWSRIDKEKEGLSDEILKNLGNTPKLTPAKEFDN